MMFYIWIGFMVFCGTLVFVIKLVNHIHGGYIENHTIGPNGKRKVTRVRTKDYMKKHNLFTKKELYEFLKNQ